MLYFVARAQEPARRRRDARRQVHRRRRQARPARDDLLLRQDPEGDRGQEVRRPTSSACRCSTSTTCMEAQVELGLGPLHTQFDDKGYAYTSLFLDTAVARWTLGGESTRPRGRLEAGQQDRRCSTTSATSAAAEGDTVSPDGKYLVALNKWSVDRFLPRRPAAAAELPAARHQRRRRHDAGDLRHADGRRRAALRPDDQGRQARSLGGLPGGRLGPAPQPVDPEAPRSPARRRSCATATTSKSS